MGGTNIVWFVPPFLNRISEILCKTFDFLRDFPTFFTHGIRPNEFLSCQLSFPLFTPEGGLGRDPVGGARDGMGFVVRGGGGGLPPPAIRPNQHPPRKCHFGLFGSGGGGGMIES